ncbi:MAG: FTR1 family iron permease [Acidimicrobiales bacterium]
MIATFVIFLREGIEASMIVAIVLAYLDRTGNRRYFRDVLIGCGVAMVLAAAGGAVAYFTIRAYAGSRVQTIFEMVTFFLAAAVLTYMTVWMRRHSRTMSAELRERAGKVLERRQRFGLAFLAFQAVGREGLETAVFTLAVIFASGRQAHLALVGGLVGLAAALAISFVIYKLGHKINLGRFFGVLSTVLMFVAAGLLSDAVENLQSLGWVTFLGTPLWDTSRILSEGSAFGDVCHSFFGYAERPTGLQLIMYAVFLAVMLFGVQRDALQARAVRVD